jgi:hypothetical protein
MIALVVAVRDYNDARRGVLAELDHTDLEAARSL